MTSQRASALIVAWLSILWLAIPATAQSVNVFQGLVKHINRQIQRDKKAFHDAQVCTEWFYKQQKKPDLPKAEGISWSGQSINTSDCANRYPGGINAAREDFSATQSALSLSLTFYQFALVGDRNDDDRYNADELQDVLESFGLAYDQSHPASIHLTELQTTFDTVHKAGGMEKLMAGMNTLYDRGYRLSPRDRAALDRITK
jgi:hypothetical protein